MKIPHEFYFNRKIETIKYASSLPGSFIPERALRSLPAFKRITTKLSPSPKNLILDPYILLILSKRIEENASQKKIIEESFKHLLDSGFKIYSDESTTLDIMQIMHNINISETDLSSTLNIKNLKQKPTNSNEQIQILDTYWFDQLHRKTENLEPRYEKMSDFQHLNTAIYFQQAMENITPPLSGILIDILSKEILKITPDILKNDFPLIFNYHHVKLSPEILEYLEDDRTLEDERFKNTIQPTILTLNNTISEIDLNKVLNLEKRIQFHKLRKINLTYSTISSSQLSTLLTAAPNLEEIDLSSCNNLKVELDLSPSSLQKLRKIHFSSSTISSNQLFTLLSAAPNLEEIDLYKCNNRKVELDLSPSSLQKLRKIHFSSSTISSSQLSTLLTAAPNLEEIDLSNCNILEGELNLKLGYLEKLKKINLTYSTISSSQLSTLLTATPNLEEIDLSSCYSLVGELDLNPSSLQKLRKINFHSSTINNHQLSILLTAAPNLEEIDLSSCKNLVGKLDLNPSSLEKLRKINLNYSTISSSQLSTLLSAAPNLEEIDLSYCYSLVRKLDLNPSSLEKLRKINLNYSTISSSQLSTLLTAAPNLEEIDLSSCSNLKGELDLDDLRLEQLQVIDLSYSYIEEGNLLKLLKATTHLRTLNLSYGGHLTCPHLKPDSLNHLEFLNLDIDVTQEQVLNILKAAPNLKKLNIPKFDTEPSEELNNLLKPLNVNFSSTITSRAGTSSGAGAGTSSGAGAGTRSGSKSKLINPSFNPKKFMTHESKIKELNPEDQFEVNQTISQGMIIDKLIHYLKQQGQWLQHIPQLKRGICRALTEFYSHHPDLKAAFTLLQSWDPSLGTPNPEQKSILDALAADVKKIYIDHHPINDYFLGDNILEHVSTLAIGELIHLQNPWHALVLKRLTETTWELYNPNYLNGPFVIATQDLVHELHQSIGTCISSPSRPTRPITLSDSNVFFEHGGLLTLSLSSDASAILDKILPLASLNPAALEGLLLRSTDGKPAWALALLHANPRITEITINLIQQLLSKNTKKQIQRLLNTLDTFNPLSRGHLIQTLSRDIPELSDSLRHINATPSDSVIDPKLFHSWAAKKKTMASPLAFCQAIIQEKSSLIESDSASDLKSIHYTLNHYARTSSKPIFHAYTPEDLICSSPTIRREGNIGLVEPQGGPLYDFIHTHPDGIIVVHYQNFDADDIVKFNTILDEEPKVDGIPIPPSMKVIGLSDTSIPDAYREADFYSRFTQVVHNDFTSEQLRQYTPQLEFIPAEDSFPIETYASKDFATILLGCWKLKSEHLFFEEGLLVQALKSGKKNWCIQNGLWDNPKFLDFWENIKDQGYVEAAGQRYLIPDDISWSRTSGYDWDALSRHLEVSDTSLGPAPLILNPSYLHTFFEHMDVVDDNSQILKGHLANHAGNHLKLYLSSAISEDDWAKLLKSCQQHEVTLEIFPAPGIFIPKIIVTHPATQLAIESQHLLIQYPDVDMALGHLGFEADLEIDISECQRHELIDKVHAEFKADSGFNFEKVSTQILQALKAGQTVILKGQFSQELVDELALLMTDNTLPGQIIIISQDLSAFTYASIAQPILDDIDLSLPLVELRTQKVQAEPFKGLRTVAQGVPDPGDFNPDTAEDDTKACLDARKQRVEGVLSQEPYVFLSGLSGVGKTQFVQRELEGSLHQGRDQIQAWLKDETLGRKYLFLDEANLSDTEWSMFEGLYQTPPGVYFEGKFYPCSEEHKLIFAGNPVSYGDQRHLASFFERHGNSVWFDVLPSGFLYEKILKPIFSGTELEADSKKLATQILAVYRFLCCCSSTEVLISPRELQMMALLMVSKHREQADIPLTNLAKDIIYQISRDLVPQAFQQDFDAAFKPEWTAPGLYPEPEKLTITPSREASYACLHDWLNLREMRSAAFSNPSQQFGGLGGIIIEGEPGVGKSEIILAALRSRAYEEAPTTHPKRFYRLPVSMDADKKEALLRQAFDEGAVVIIDEINASGMMEQLLNSLLMGKTPEGNPPTKPGFMLIGSQNPDSYSGRRQASTALARRMTKLVLPIYPEPELLEILIKRGLEETQAKAYIQAFLSAVKEAKTLGYRPIPSVRDLIKTIARCEAQLKHPRSEEESLSIKPN